MKWENGPEISVMKKDGMVCEGLWWRLTFSPSVLACIGEDQKQKTDPEVGFSIWR
ncbi:hypothetical protein [Aeromonas media]|uniref:hypothetical protein n=1 Tax=Aeromonas media TaxID=651 RepID=UPI0012E040AB|nr:hypothetical protein [Aeromonas media]MBS4639970.1 hypothetical protein [Aeromonas media]